MRRAGLLICAGALCFLAGCGAMPYEPEAPRQVDDLNHVEVHETMRASITVAGDLVLHMTLNNQSRTQSGDYDYTPLFEDVEHYIADADLALCTFEGALSAGNYQGYPMFLTPDGLAQSLKAVGFDLVATASNHCLDGGKAGLDRTLDVLDAAGLSHLGTYRTEAEREESGGVIIEDLNGIKIAFLDYTYGTNGAPTGNYPYAVNLFYSNEARREIDEAAIIADLNYAKALEPDLIAVIAHWGDEYITTKQPSQEALADFLIENGADMILGGHPHVPQPAETVELPNGERGIVSYCLGNLLANMKEEDHAHCTLTAMLQIEIEKDGVTGKTVISEAKYIPMAIIDTQDLNITGADWRFRLWDLNSAIADYEAGQTRGGIITETLYNTLIRYRADLEGIMGSELMMRDDA